ncbi:sulfurtransferase TusA family protein [Paenibacillus sp. IITD108]|uniref:sulfurtransferase TusA family protein n=1 Tax=Paenibacillus sp. IITD108 TaxID=3116649 RepID=UPI002F42F791
MKSDKLLDATGLACPMPIVRTKKMMAEMDAGQILEVHATDKGSQGDIAAWSKSTGNELLESAEDNGLFKFWIKKS